MGPNLSKLLNRPKPFNFWIKDVVQETASVNGIY